MEEEFSSYDYPQWECNEEATEKRRTDRNREGERVRNRWEERERQAEIKIVKSLWLIWEERYLVANNVYFKAVFSLDH